MMQFGKTWEKVLSGEKTATSRIVKPGDFTSVMWTDEHDKYGRIVPDQPNHGPIVRVEMPYWLAEKSQIQRVMNGERTVYCVGQDYAVQPGRGQKSIGRICITGIERYDVRGILLDQVAKEGYGDDPLEFLRVWVDMHDKGSAWYWREDDGSYRQWRGRSRKWESSNAQGIYDFLATRPAAKYDAWFLTFELLKGSE